MDRETITRAAESIRRAESLVITAGAGIGVDSGLPDFRGDTGFWRAYPMYERLGITFVGAANPEHFQRDPEFGWGFYGHRSNLYRDAAPHDGFRMLLGWIRRFDLDHFVVTSNVDGQFQKAGFSESRILEVHGSIHYLQCLRPCTRSIWANRESFDVDLATMRSRSIPRCSACGGVARPNILMFGDFSWLPDRTDAQEAVFDTFLEATTPKTMVVIEMGAGTAIPTIRALSERLGRQGATVIRINPREPEIPHPHLSVTSGSLAALSAIESALGKGF